MEVTLWSKFLNPSLDSDNPIVKDDRVSQQISHAAMMKNSMNKAGVYLPLIASQILSQTSTIIFQWTPNFCQQAREKRQPKNRWSISSGTLPVHNTQNSFGCTRKFLLRSIVLVLSLSTSINHKKNLILGIHLDFQSALKIGCTCEFSNTIW